MHYGTKDILEAELLPLEHEEHPDDYLDELNPGYEGPEEFEKLSGSIPFKLPLNLEEFMEDL